MTRDQHKSAAPRPPEVPLSANLDPPSYSVAGFCAAHHLARSNFYNLLKHGRGPTVYRVGRRLFVAGEEAARWRRAMQHATTSGGTAV
jgi:hypothetical protein